MGPIELVEIVLLLLFFPIPYYRERCMGKSLKRMRIVTVTSPVWHESLQAIPSRWFWVVVEPGNMPKRIRKCLLGIKRARRSFRVTMHQN